MSDEEQLDLNHFTMRPGEGRREPFTVAPPATRIGGQDFAATGPIEADVGISRTNDGYALHLTYDTEVAGPCQRCLEPALIPVSVNAREVDHPAAGDEELQSPYVSDELLDMGAWVRDSMRLAMPEKPLCGADCKGLCVVCGVSLNDADPADHEHGQNLDPRFAKLRELDLGQD